MKLRLAAIALIILCSIIAQSHAVEIRSNIIQDIEYDRFADYERGLLDLIPAVDTLAVRRHIAANDSYFVIYQVDEIGDTLAYRLRVFLNSTEHLRTWGPYTNTKAADGAHFKEHRMEWYTPGQTANSAVDFCADQGTQISNYASERIYDTELGICFERSWRYAETTFHDDTLDVVQTVWAFRGQPWLRVKYDFTFVSQGTKTDSIRFYWQLQSEVKPQGSWHDILWAPGYGNVLKRQVFEADEIGYAACAIGCGNPLAAAPDSGFKSRGALLLDYGSGNDTWGSTGIMWNPDIDIVPNQIAFIDTAGWLYPSLHADSLDMHCDSTNVLDSNARWIFARTPWYTFSTDDEKSAEFAVFRGYILGDQFPPVWPEVTWSTGGISRIAPTRKR